MLPTCYRHFGTDERKHYLFMVIPASHSSKIPWYQTFASDPIGKCSYATLMAIHVTLVGLWPAKWISFRPASSSGQRHASRHRNKMVAVIWGDRVLPGLFSGDRIPLFCPFIQNFFWFRDNQCFSWISLNANMASHLFLGKNSRFCMVRAWAIGNSRSTLLNYCVVNCVTRVSLQIVVLLLFRLPAAPARGLGWFSVGRLGRCDNARSTRRYTWRNRGNSAMDLE